MLKNRCRCCSDNLKKKKKQKKNTQEIISIAIAFVLNRNEKKKTMFIVALTQICVRVCLNIETKTKRRNKFNLFFIIHELILAFTLLN